MFLLLIASQLKNQAQFKAVLTQFIQVLQMAIDSQNLGFFILDLAPPPLALREVSFISLAAGFGGTV